MRTELSILSSNCTTVIHYFLHPHDISLGTPSEKNDRNLNGDKEFHKKGVFPCDKFHGISIGFIFVT